MIMNKVIAILVAFFSVFCAYAQKADKSEQYRVRITKVDGTTLEGYSMTSFYNTMLPEVRKFTFSTEYKGKTTTYTSEEVKRVEFVNLEMDSMPLVYESVQALSTIPGPLRKNPKPFKKPVFLRLFYNGKNVKGYTMPFADNTYTKSSTTSRDTWKYYYLTKDATYANAYWLDVKGIRVAIKKELKFALKDFPEVIKKIENDEISLKEFKKDPKMILPLLDQSYKK